MAWEELLRAWSTIRLSVPVVVIESDDWGWDYVHPNGFVAMSPELDARQAQALDRLADILDRHHDAMGRHPVLSAFVVVGQPDTEEIVADSSRHYHWRPIGQAMPRLVKALNAAAARGLVSLAYHARDHRECRTWVKVIRQASEVRQLDGAAAADAANSFMAEGGPQAHDRLIGEYFNSVDSCLGTESQEDIDGKVSDGIAAFESAFSMKPRSTVAPRHLWNSGAEEAWKKHGILYVHGVNHQRGETSDPKPKYLRGTGFRTRGGMVGIKRNVPFELVDSDGQTQTNESVMGRIEQVLSGGEPVVILTHSHNFYSCDPQTTEKMVQRFEGLLSAMERRWPNLIYLSADELGELAGQGHIDYPQMGRGVQIRGCLSKIRILVRTLWHGRPQFRFWVIGVALLFLLGIGLLCVKLLT